MKIFMTGTDTNVGKTYVSHLLLKKWNEQGLQTIGLKPVASGCEWIEGQYINQDAYTLQKAASIHLTYSQVNPFCFKTPVAPHIAAQKEGLKLRAQEISDHIQNIAQINHDVMLIEGVGGLMVPFNKKELQLDLIKALNIPVLFVVGLKLGCLNHTLLSIAMLKAYQIPIKGWIINHIDPLTECVDENITTLKHYLKEIPYLGYILFEESDPFFKSVVSP
ncbi:MAG: dethiobiotin synthase [Alphaproteobacteria bacterium]|nr:dethiobiotin synthase [Alphaproteobacteria bacterium]